MQLEGFTSNISSRGGVYLFYIYSHGKYYIGESVNIKRRIKEHLSGNGKEEIYRAYKENGLDDLGFQILCFEDDREKRIELEQKYKLYYGLGRLLNSISTKENGSAGKSVLAFTKEGKLHKRFNSLSEGSAYVNRKIGTISDSLLGKADFVGGYMWFYEDSFSNEVLQRRLLNRKIRNIKNKTRLAKQAHTNGEKGKKLVLGRNHDEEIIFMSLSDAARYFNVGVANISACCLGHQKRIKNYEWSFINE